MDERIAKHTHCWEHLGPRKMDQVDLLRGCSCGFAVRGGSLFCMMLLTVGLSAPGSAAASKRAHTDGKWRNLSKHWVSPGSNHRLPRFSCHWLHKATKSCSIWKWILGVTTEDQYLFIFRNQWSFACLQRITSLRRFREMPIGYLERIFTEMFTWEREREFPT